MLHHSIDAIAEGEEENTDLLKSKTVKDLPLFCELQELQGEEWFETARWVSFEESVEPCQDRWSKPFVSALPMSSLVRVRNMMNESSNGTLILDLKVESFPQLASAVAEQLFFNDENLKNQFEAKLLLNHVHQLQQMQGLTCCSKRSNSETRKPNTVLSHKLTAETEAASIFAGKTDFLTAPVICFIRIQDECKPMLPECSEVDIPTRFVVFYLTTFDDADCHVTGRALATLLSDDKFRQSARRFNQMSDLVSATETFMDSLTAMPSNKLSWHVRIPPPTMDPQHHIVSEDDEAAKAALEVDPTILRTGRFFGGLVADVKRKLPWYLSDFKDALNAQCFGSFVYMFFGCLAPIITFGGLYGVATNNEFAAFESILAGAICGTTFHLFAGQPISIIATTGPTLLFEKILFGFCQDHDLDFLSFRFWIGISMAVYLMIIVAFDLSAMVQLITRFTEESFATLVSIIFIYEAFLAVHQTPSNAQFVELNQNFSCWCETTGESSLNCSSSNQTICQTQCDSKIDCQSANTDEIFYFSYIIFLGTCFISVTLAKFKFTSFFTSRIRHWISDFSVSIAILVMVLLDWFVGIHTQKLLVPDKFAPTKEGRSWVADPFLNPTWTIVAAPLPGILLTILYFMDQQIPAVIVNRRENKLKKGSGYHLDMFVLSWQVAFCATFGLPYYVAATVLTIAHVNSLRKFSKVSAPGEHATFLGLREQRVTGFLVFLLIGFSIPLRSFLKFIPMPVLYGVFFYMGISALQNLQFFDRCLLLMMPVKYQPDDPYIRHVKTMRIHLFTGIQLLAFIFLWAIQAIKPISILFVVMLVVMVILRKLLEYVFTEEELMWIDDPLPKNPLR